LGGVRTPELLVASPASQRLLRAYKFRSGRKFHSITAST
jgi:hypothetical protein